MFWTGRVGGADTRLVLDYITIVRRHERLTPGYLRL